MRCHLSQSQGRGLGILSIPSVALKLPSTCSGDAGHFWLGSCSHRPPEDSAPLSNSPASLAGWPGHPLTHRPTKAFVPPFIGGFLLSTEGGKKKGGMEAFPHP